jgi:hypothetical protein
MCAPLALGGLQVAAQLAGAAAQGRQARDAARLAERDARSQAAAATARAERLRDEAARGSAAARARAFAGAVDPKSESLVASLAEAHARSLDPVLALDHEAALALDAGQRRARALKAAGRQAVARSLLGMVTAAAAGSGTAIRIPL